MAKIGTARELAEILDITERRVNQIVTEKGTFERTIDGKFDISTCVMLYYQEKFSDNDFKDQLDRERMLHERVKREKTELEVSKLKGELHEADDVEYIMTNMLVTFRNRILGIPSALAPVLVGQKNINKISEIIDLKLREALSELAEYDPGMFTGEDENGVEEDGTEDSPVIPENS